MDLYKHHQRVWKILYFILKPFIKLKFNVSLEQINVDGPIVLIANHTNTWDPLIIAVALKNKQVYFVASEHILRLGFVSKIINWLVAPIARKKGASGKETTKECLKHLHAGHSICLFAEGEQSWDGLSNKVIKGTGGLIKDSKATLVTYRLYGTYLSLPRFSDKQNKGKIIGEIAGIYTYDQLKDKDIEEINDIINKDIFVDIWKYQEDNKIVFKGKHKAEHIERMLYLCPNCNNISSIKGIGNNIKCNCGLDLLIDDYGFLKPEKPFKTIHEWEIYQKDKIRKLDFNSLDNQILFKEKNANLIEIFLDHTSKEINNGELSISLDRLICGDSIFELKEINKMAMTRYGVLLFTYKDHYYQIKIEGEVNLRKYLEIYKKINNKE